MMRARTSLVTAVAAVAAASVAPTAIAAPFSYTPAGQLIPANAGDGVAEARALAPQMRFPIETPPAYANSQVWGNGGYLKGSGAECDAANFSYPWHDDYCEDRPWTMPLCPGGTGHQGQDIRPATCKNLTHWTVATVDGTIISASGPGTGTPGYQVILAGEDGTRYRYLHMGNVQVAVGQKLKRGDRIAQVSREFNGTPTTVHLHFDLMQNVAPHGLIFVSPYTSLVRSYERLLGIADAGVDDAGQEGGPTKPADDAGWPTEPNGPVSEDAAADAAPASAPVDDSGCAVARGGRGGRGETAPRPSFALLFVALGAIVVAARRRARVVGHGGGPPPGRVPRK